MYTSDILPDHDTPSAALIVLLTSICAVRPQVVADNSAEWRRALADLQHVDVRIEVKPGGRVALSETAPEPGRLTEAERVRTLVRQSPSWVRAVTSTSRWSSVLQRLAVSNATQTADATSRGSAGEMQFGMSQGRVV